MSPARLSTLPHAEYLALTELSSSSAGLLLATSPKHARRRRGKDPSKSTDRGSIGHRLLLGRGQEYEVLDFADYRKHAAQQARDKARAEGRIPVLAEEMGEIETAVAAIRDGLLERGVILDGQSEVTVQWEEPSPHGPVPCKGMLDHLWLRETSARILDLKIVENAAPPRIERSSEDYGYAIQACAYTRGVTALDPRFAGRVEFVFAFCEFEDPYAINLCSPDGMFRELGERRWLRAVHTWGKCLALDEWPDYGRHVNQLSPPPWALAREGFVRGEDY